MNEAQAIATVVEGEDLEEQVFAQRLAGRSERWISRRFGLSCDEVREICIRLLPTFDRALREQELALEISRVNALTTQYFPRALAGDDAATCIYIKLSERRGSLLALDKAPERTSTELIKAALDRLANEGKPPQIEALAEASEVPSGSLVQ
jgi:hypothetical protein